MQMFVGTPKKGLRLKSYPPNSGSKLSRVFDYFSVSSLKHLPYCQSNLIITGLLCNTFFLTFLNINSKFGKIC